MLKWYYWVKCRVEWLWGSGVWICVGINHAEATVNVGAYGRSRREVEGRYLLRYPKSEIWRSFNLSRRVPEFLRMLIWLVDGQVPEDQAIKIMQGIVGHIAKKLQSGDDSELSGVRRSDEAVGQPQGSGVLAVQGLPDVCGVSDGQGVAADAVSLGAGQEAGGAVARCSGEVPEPERCVPASEA